MCIRYYRYCSDCDKVYYFDTDINVHKIPIIVYDSVCSEHSCQRRASRALNNTLLCDSLVCTPDKCRIECISMICKKMNTRDWTIVSRPEL